MSKYEGMFVLDNSRVKPDTADCVAAVTAMLEKHAATIAKIDKWDERKLAYEIRKQKRGTYVLVHFEADQGVIAALRHDLSLNEDVLRSLILRLEDAFPVFQTAAEIEALRPKREDDDRGDDGFGRRRDDGGGGDRRRGRRDDEIPNEMNV